MRLQESAFRCESLKKWSATNGGYNSDIELDTVYFTEGSSGVRFRTNKEADIPNLGGSIQADISYTGGRDLSAYENFDIYFFLRVSPEDAENIGSVGISFTDTDDNITDWYIQYQYIDGGAYYRIKLSDAPSSQSSGSFSWKNIKMVSFVFLQSDTNGIASWVTIDDIYATNVVGTNHISRQLPDWWNGEEDRMVIATEIIYRDLVDRIQQFILNANLSNPCEHTIESWEKLLSLPVKTGYQIIERTVRLKSLFVGSNSTIKRIRQTVTDVVGSDPIIYEHYNNKDAAGDDFFTVSVYVPTPAIAGYDDTLLQSEIDKIAPAHCIVKINFITEISESATTPSESIATENLQGGTFEGGGFPIDWSGDYIWL